MTVQSKHIRQVENGVELQMRLVQGSCSPRRLKTGPQLRSDAPAALFLVKPGTPHPGDVRSTEGQRIFYSRRSDDGKTSRRTVKTHFAPLQQGRDNLVGAMVMGGLVWFAQALGAWLHL